MLKKWSEYFNSYAGLLTFLGALLGALGIAAVVYQQGYSVGKDVFQGRLEESQKDEKDQEGRADKAEEQVTQLRLEVASKGGADIKPVEVKSVSRPSQTLNPFVPAKVSPRIVRATIQPGNSARLFDGSLIVSLVGVEFGGDPLGYQATINVVAGTTIKQIKKGQVGTQVTLAGHKVTVVTVTSTDVTVEAG